MPSRPFRKLLLLLLVLPVFCACNFIQGGSGGTPPSPPQSGIERLTLASQDPGGNAFYIYSGTASDPLAFSQRPGAIITAVTNTSGYGLSLAHGGPGSLFVILEAGQKVTVFNGLPVEGNWTAEVEAQRASAPLSVSLEIAWKAP